MERNVQVNTSTVPQTRMNTPRHRKGEEISSVIGPQKRMLFTFKIKTKKGWNKILEKFKNKQDNLLRTYN